MAFCIGQFLCGQRKGYLSSKEKAALEKKIQENEQKNYEMERLLREQLASLTNELDFEKSEQPIPSLPTKFSKSMSLPRLETSPSTSNSCKIDPKSPISRMESSILFPDISSKNQLERGGKEWRSTW